MNYQWVRQRERLFFTPTFHYFRLNYSKILPKLKPWNTSASTESANPLWKMKCVQNNKIYMPWRNSFFEEIIVKSALPRTRLKTPSSVIEKRTIYIFDTDNLKHPKRSVKRLRWLWQVYGVAHRPSWRCHSSMRTFYGVRTATANGWLICRPAFRKRTA